METSSFLLKQLPSWNCLSLPWPPRHVPISSPQFLAHKSHFLSVSTSQQSLTIWNSSSNGSTKHKTSTKKRRSLSRSSSSTFTDITKPNTTLSSSDIPAPAPAKQAVREKQERRKSVLTLKENGDPLGRKDLGKSVVKWISQAMRAMASEFSSAEAQGEFTELRQRMGPGLTFVIQAQPYLNAVPMPLGLEAICLKACTHYPTLFDHFQRELREVLQDLMRKGLVQDWKKTESWKLLKELANSAQHRVIARKVTHPKPLQGVLGMNLEKAKAIQGRISEFTNQMSELLRIERDAELEFTQEELNAVPTVDESSDSSKPIEFLVSHGQGQQELCDTICNLYAVRTSTGLGGMHLVLFRVEGNHRLPPTTLSPGDMVCVRICDSRGAGATSSLQGFVNNLGEDGCSISVALESRHGDPTFSKLSGKSVRIDRIHGLADTVTYERNCEALMLLQKNGLHKKNPSIAVVATLFADFDERLGKPFDDSQQRAITLGLNKKRPLLIIQGPPGTGTVGQGERVLVTAPTNAAVDNMKKSDLRKDLSHCLKDDSLAAGIRQLLKQEVLSSAQVVLATNTGAADPLIRRLDAFDLVVIDEAGQAIEPSCWIPILQGKRWPWSLSLERASILHEGVHATNLTTQYRMNDAISSWASKEMYSGLLKSSSTVASHLLVDSPFVKPTWITQCPLLLLDTRMPYGSLSVGCEEHLDPAGTGSFYNEGEADIVVQHVFSLIFSGVRPTAIAVQSPYVAQVQLLRERLDELPEADGVEVATIDSFQGREADAVIISMERSRICLQIFLSL
ncbi:DNA-binding protein [Salix suchowensis]|nr:DNA-binding protein [Salix suchowensis]